MSEFKILIFQTLNKVKLYLFIDTLDHRLKMCFKMIMKICVSQIVFNFLTVLNELF